MAAQDTSNATNPHPGPLPKGEGNQGSSSTVDIGNPYTPRRPSPIVSISINHPIAQMARKVKNFLTHKQTLFSTTFSIKVTPIVAIVSLFGVLALFGGGVTTAFQLGKTFEQKFLASTLLPSSPKQIIVAPTPIIVSKSGTVKATYQYPPTPMPTQTGSQSATTTASPSSPPLILHYILTSRNGSITYLSGNPLIHLQNYLNLRVLITGSFDSTRNTLTISKLEDIEVLQ